MELKDKILKIMTVERLSASVFADRIGVQRSSISHILSGRNKPSLEFLQKIIGTFPNYSTEWLFMGNGTMHKDTEQEVPEVDSLTNQSLFEEKNSVNSVPAENIEQSRPTVEPIKPQHQTNPSINTPIVAAVNNTNKVVEQIIICYSDKTFDTYSPK